MNILYIGHEENLNGASLCMLELIDHMISLGHKVYVLTSYEYGPFYKELEHRNVSIVVYHYHRWIVKKQESPFMWFIMKAKIRLALFCERVNIHKLCYQLKKYNIDIVHTNSSVICVGAWIAKKIKSKHIWHLREFGKEDFQMYPIYSEKCTWKYMRKNADYFIAISDAIKQKYIELLGEKKIKRIYDGVPICCTRRERNYCKTNINLLIAGRIGEAKGQIEVVKALIELFFRGYKFFTLYIAGEGDMRQIKELKGFDLISSKIVFCGYVRNLNQLRKDIDIELVCSKSEGFGRTTIEAMMMGIPVIGANTGATPELIINGKNGFLYKKGNIIDLADKILRLACDADYFEISKFAYEYAHKYFNINTNAQNIVDLYYEVLSN